jgi:hypothetical protein
MDCNSELMPPWLAVLTVTLFDGLPKRALTAVATRYGGSIAHWHALDDAAWEKIRDAFLIYAIDISVLAAQPLCVGQPYWPAVASSCEAIKGVISFGDKEAIRAATLKADRAAREASRAAASAAWAGDDVAKNNAEVAVEVAFTARAARASELGWPPKAAEAAAETAALTVPVVAPRTARDRAARKAAHQKAHQTMFDYLLDQIERALPCA